MGFFSTPPGYKPADSITISLTAALGVMVIYNAKVGPAADVGQMTSGNPAINSAIKKAGVESLLLVAAVALLSRDLNVAILGGAAVCLEHVMYLHSEIANPANGQIEVNPAAYQPAGSTTLAAAAA
jgi:hypothetical protein